MASKTANIIKSLIGTIIGVVLYPVLADVVSGVNATGTSAIILNAIPIFYLIAILAGEAFYVYSQIKEE